MCFLLQIWFPLNCQFFRVSHFRQKMFLIVEGSTFTFLLYVFISFFRVYFFCNLSITNAIGEKPFRVFIWASRFFACCRLWSDSNTCELQTTQKCGAFEIDLNQFSIVKTHWFAWQANLPKENDTLLYFSFYSASDMSLPVSMCRFLFGRIINYYIFSNFTALLNGMCVYACETLFDPCPKNLATIVQCAFECVYGAM